MVEIFNTQMSGLDGAVRGMRNPYDSWHKSDSMYVKDKFVIGEKDMDLCLRLIKGGAEHRKFLRMVHVQADIKAPLYWWKQFDTYKVATVANSQSTMHTITKNPFRCEDFSIDGGWRYAVEGVVDTLNALREQYLKMKAPIIWRTIIQLLPCSYNQLRTVDLNYETLITIYRQRKNHKLSEWQQLCKWVEDLPYMKEFLNVLQREIEENN